MAEHAPRLYELRRDRDEDDVPEVLAWGMALPDGRAVTCWRGPGTGVAVGGVDTLECRLAPMLDSYLVWLPA